MPNAEHPARVTLPAEQVQQGREGRTLRRHPEQWQQASDAYVQAHDRSGLRAMRRVALHLNEGEGYSLMASAILLAAQTARRARALLLDALRQILSTPLLVADEATAQLPRKHDDVHALAAQLLAAQPALTRAP